MEGDRTYQLKGGKRPQIVGLSEYSAKRLASEIPGQRELEILENYADKQQRTNPEPYNIGNAVIAYNDGKQVRIRLPQKYLKHLDDLLRLHY